jgi:hypothetical protein
LNPRILRASSEEASEAVIFGFGLEIEAIGTNFPLGILFVGLVLNFDWWKKERGIFFCVTRLRIGIRWRLCLCVRYSFFFFFLFFLSLSKSLLDGQENVLCCAFSGGGEGKGGFLLGSWKGGILRGG